MKYSSLFLSSLFLIFVVSCNNQTPKNQNIDDELQMDVSVDDTTEVKSLVGEFLGCMERGQLDSCIQMLYFIQADSSLMALPKDLADKQRMLFEPLIGKKYRQEVMVFHKEIDSVVKIVAELFPLEGPDDHRPNTMSFVIRPVRLDGKWFLTMPDSKSDQIGHGGTEVQL